MGDSPDAAPSPAPVVPTVAPVSRASSRASSRSSRQAPGLPAASFAATEASLTQSMFAAVAPSRVQDTPPVRREGSVAFDQPHPARPGTTASTRSLNTFLSVEQISKTERTEQASGRLRLCQLNTEPNRTRRAQRLLAMKRAESASSMRKDHLPSLNSSTASLTDSKIQSQLSTSSLFEQTVLALDLEKEVERAMQFFGNQASGSEESGSISKSQERGLITAEIVRNAFQQLGLRLSRKDIDILFPKGCDSWTAEDLLAEMQNADWHEEFDPIAAAMSLYSASNQHQRELHTHDLVRTMTHVWPEELTQFDVDILLETAGEDRQSVSLKNYRALV